MPLSDIDTDQRLAATASGGEVAISAGAGSGKTRLLVSRYLNLIRKENLPLSSIAAITFTNKAANQMKARIAEKALELAVKNPHEREMWMKIAENSYHASISTIHSFCSSILRSHPVEVGLDPFFTVVDEVTNSELKHEVINHFVVAQMTDEPDDMAFLIDIFGMMGLKNMLNMLLDKRAHVVKFLDSIENSGSFDAETLKDKYKINILKRLDDYIYTLEKFHSFRPEDDGLVPVYDMLVGELLRVREMAEKETVDANYINNIVNAVSLKAGSHKKWGKERLKALRDGMKSCRAFLESLSSFYVNERDVIAKVTSLLMREYNLVERIFLKQKKIRSCLDNDDILIETWKLLRTNSKLCQKISQTYKHILVDEFQDTDGIQMDILRMIAGNTSATLFTVGDSKQSIFRFRGADVTVFDEIKLKADNYFCLKINYRSSPSLMSFINSVFKRSMSDEPANIFEAEYIEMKPYRKDIGNSPAAELVIVDIAGSDMRRLNEAEFIARRAHELNRGNTDGNKYPFGDMALLLRKSTNVKYYEEAFLREGIPFVNRIGGKLSGSPEAYDIGNLLSWLHHPDDPVLLTAVLLSPFFNFDSDTLFKIRTMAGSAEKIPFFILKNEKSYNNNSKILTDIKKAGEILKRLLSISGRVSMRDILEKAFDKTDYTITLQADMIQGERSLAILDLILETAETFEKNGGSSSDFAELLISGRMFTKETACVEPKGDALSILTIHGAKGLEFKVVFLADVTSGGRKNTNEIVFDDNLGPGFTIRDAHGGNVKTYVNRYSEHIERQKEIAESKRLFYVGCTRAEDHLIISGGKPPLGSDCNFEKDNWMNWLHTSLSILPDGDLSDCNNDLFKYHRILENNVVKASTFTDHWKKLLKSAKEEIILKDYSIDKFIGRVKSIPTYGAPEHISPTQLIDYIICPTLYKYKHIHGLDMQYSENHNEGMGYSFGLLAHTVLEKVDFKDIESWNSFVETSAGKNVPEVMKKKLKDDLRRFSESDLYNQIVEAEEIRREEPFAFIEDKVLVRGNIDLIYKSGNNLVIVDYKTDNIGIDELNNISYAYTLQIGIYALAVYRAEYTMPSKMVLHFLTPGLSREISCNQNVIDDVSNTLSKVIKSISTENFSPVRSDKCDICPYSNLCATKSRI